MTPLMTVSLESGSFQSFKAPFTWSIFRPLTVLCGQNGGGKTQLLRLVEDGLRNSTRPEYQLTVSPKYCEPWEATYMPPGWHLAATPGLQLIQPVAQARNYIKQLRDRAQTHKDARAQGILAALQAQLRDTTNVKLEQLDEQTVFDMLPLEAPLHLQDWNASQLPQRMAQVFTNYNLRRIDAAERGRTVDDFVRVHGPPPWDLLNSMLESLGSPYRVNAPRGLVGTYEMRFLDSARGVTLAPNQLSSGEQALLSLALWLYAASSHRNSFPKVLLLDEPDAHLHPSLVPRFLSVLQDTLVVKHGCLIVMSTHRPETIAAAPEGALCEVRRDEPRVRPGTTRREALREISGSLFTVLPGVRLFFVEDEDDVQFYETAFELVLTGNSSATSGLFTPAFRAVSSGRGRGRDPGGCQKVRDWVAKFSDTSLQEILHGIIDRDAGNAPAPGLHVLPRYSIENFTVDPLIIAATLIEAEIVEHFPQIATLRPGQSRNILQLEPEALQGLVDDISARVLAELAPGPSAREGEVTEIRYTSGLTIRVPRWALMRKGKDVRGAVFRAFEQRIDVQELRRSLIRLGLVPEDLHGFVLSSLAAETG